MRMRAVNPLLLLYILAATVSCGWFGYMYRPEYDFAIDAIEVKQGTEPPVSAAVPHGTDKRTFFKDDWLVWNWSVGSRELSLTLQNRTDESLAVGWALARYTSVDGKQHRLIDRGVEYRDRNEPKPEVQLEPGSTRRDSVYPADYMHWQDNKVVEWRHTTLVPQLPGIATSDQAKAEEFARQQLGKTVAVMLPVKGPDGLREYTFVLVIHDYHVKRIIAS